MHVVVRMSSGCKKLVDVLDERNRDVEALIYQV